MQLQLLSYLIPSEHDRYMPAKKAINMGTALEVLSPEANLAQCM